MQKDFSYIFICGVKRSGTTVLTSLLDGHPDLFVLPGEFQVFGRVALGQFAPKETHPVGTYLEAISWYTQLLAAKEKKVYRTMYQCSFDIADVLAEVSAISELLTRWEFLQRFVLACMKADGRDPASVQYVVIKTMHNGIDFTDPLVARQWKLMPERDPMEAFLSHRTKFLRRDTFFAHQLLGNFFVQNYQNAHVPAQLRALGETIGSFVCVSLDKLKEDSSVAMRRVADELGISYHDILAKPTFGGEAYDGNFHDAQKNTGTIVQASSRRIELYPLERWAMDRFGAGVAIANPSDSFRFTLWLPWRLRVHAYMSYVFPMIRNITLCFFDVCTKTLRQLARGHVRAVIKLPWVLLLLVHHHVFFCRFVLARQQDVFLRKNWGLHFPQI